MYHRKSLLKNVNMMQYGCQHVIMSNILSINFECLKRLTLRFFQYTEMIAIQSIKS